MLYKDFFKKTYSYEVENKLKSIVSDLPKDIINYKDLLTQLYLSVTEVIFEYIKHNNINKAMEFKRARFELEEIFVNQIGSIPLIDSLINTEKTILNAYSDAIRLPNMVESIYYTILRNLINKQDLNDIENSDFNIKLYKKLEENLNDSASNFKDYLQNNYPEQLNIPKKANTLLNIKDYNIAIKQLDEEIISIENRIELLEHSCIASLGKKSETQEFILSLKELQENCTSQQKQKDIENIINNLNNESIIQSEYMSNLDKQLDQCIDNYNSIINAKNFYVNKIYFSKNYFLSRLEALKNFELEKIKEIGFAETSAILNNEQDKIRIYEILKYHIAYSQKILELYYKILKHKQSIRESLTSYNQQNNYNDILQAEKEANNTLLLIKSYDLDIENYEDIAKIILTVIIYRFIKIGNFDNWRNKFSFWDDYIEYANDYNKYSPLILQQNKPEGFVSFTDFKDRSNFSNQWDFNEQFNVYKKKFSEYESKIITRSIIKSGITKLNEDDILNPIQRCLYFQEVSGIGGVMFIKLQNSNWVVASSLGMAFRIKKYIQKEIEQYECFNDICNFEKSFIKDYIKTPILKMPGPFPRDILYPTWENVYPKARLSKEFSNELKEGEKVSNYDNYFQFWKDFYDTDVIKSCIYYKKDETPIYANTNLVASLDHLFKDTLDKYAEYCRNSMDKTGLMHEIATVLVPFYDVLYKELTNSEYKITKSDVASIVIDTTSFIFIMLGAGIKITNIQLKSLMKGVQLGKNLGITNRMDLLVYSTRSIPSLTKEMTRIVLKAAFSLVNPIPFVSLPTRFPRISKFFRNSFKIKSDTTLEQLSYFSKSGELDLFWSVPVVGGSLKPKWSVNNRVIYLPESTKRYDAYFKNVYEVTPESPYSLTEKDYYIKQGGYVYQVEWDDYCHTWRVIGQSNTSRSSYKTPVKWDNVSERWITHSAIPGGGGSPMKTANLINISAEDIKPLIDFLEEVKKEAIKKLIVTKDIIEQSKQEELYNVNKAFNIFFGYCNNDIKSRLIINITNQIEVLKLLNFKHDIVYHAGFCSNDSKTYLSTYDNSFYDIKINKKEPFIHLFVDHLVNIYNNLGYNKKKLKQFTISSLIHELHHATNKKTGDHAYARIYKDRSNFTVKFDLSLICMLPKSAFSGIAPNLIVQNEHLLKWFSTNKKIVELIDARNEGKKNIHIINKHLLKEVILEMSKSDRYIVENPDNTVFLINLLYTLKENKDYFDNFIERYNKWRKNVDEVLAWEYIDYKSSSNIKFKSTDTGKINEGIIAPLTKKGLFYTKKIESIDVDFDYIVSNVNELIDTKIKSFKNSTPNEYLDYIITTWKGNNIIHQNIGDYTAGIMKKFRLSNNINFINIYNVTNEIVGIRVALKKIKYGSPIVIYSNKLGFGTTIHTINNNYLYVYYTGKTLDKSIIEITKAHEKIYEGTLIKLRHTKIDTIEGLIELLGANYKQSIISASGINPNKKYDTFPIPEVDNVKMFQYNDAIVENSLKFKVGQSFALLTKNLHNKTKIVSYSESFALNLEKNKTKIQNLSSAEFILL